MILERLGYQHRIGEAGVEINRQALYTELKELWAIVQTWTITGRIRNPTGDPKDLDAEIANIEAIYSTNGGDLILKHDDGTPTAHAIYNIDTIGGIVVKQPPTFSAYRNGEYVSYRTYKVVLEATQNAFPAGSQILYSWKEELKFSGGGPKFVWLEPNTGPPILQMAKAQTPYRATQSGRIVTIFDEPNLPPPIWLANLMANPVTTKSSPTPFGLYGGVRAVLYGLNYSYEFESVLPLIGSPINPLP